MSSGMSSLMSMLNSPSLTGMGGMNGNSLLSTPGAAQLPQSMLENREIPAMSPLPASLSALSGSLGGGSIFPMNSPLRMTGCMTNSGSGSGFPNFGNSSPLTSLQMSMGGMGGGMHGMSNGMHLHGMNMNSGAMGANIQSPPGTPDHIANRQAVAIASTAATSSPLVKLEPPSQDSDYFFNLEHGEGISDFYTDTDTFLT